MKYGITCTSLVNGKVYNASRIYLAKKKKIKSGRSEPSTVSSAPVHTSQTARYPLRPYSRDCTLVFMLRPSLTKMGMCQQV